MNLTRRGFLQNLGTIAAATAVYDGTGSTCEARLRCRFRRYRHHWYIDAECRYVDPLHCQVGVVTSSLSSHLAATSTRGKFTLLELPRILRDELDMRVIDLASSSLASLEPGYLDQVRSAVENAGCLISNLKLNQPGLDMNSPDPTVRRRALAEYKRSLDAASRLGARWARPLPRRERPNMSIHVASYRELAEYAAARNVRMLVENYGWMESDPRSVVQLVADVGFNVAAGPDTGNWANNEIRYQGLALTLPQAVTCDFKARQLGPEGQHAAYDLQRCFAIGWRTGFRGPWCLEHAHPDQATLFRNLGILRDLLRRWMREHG